jgi:hypothetical protein
VELQILQLPPMQFQHPTCRQFRHRYWVACDAFFVWQLGPLTGHFPKEMKPPKSKNQDQSQATYLKNDAT